MLTTFKNLFTKSFVRNVDEIMAPLNSIIASLEQNAEVAAQSGKRLEFEADYALAEAEEFKRQKEAESVTRRQTAGQLYDTAAVSVQRAEKLRGLFS